MKSNNFNIKEHDLKLIDVFFDKLRLKLKKKFLKSSSNMLLNIKHDGSIVTEVDISIERMIISLILDYFPTHSILGEEYGISNNEYDSDYMWVLDPLDGTKSFVYGHITYGTLLAYNHKVELNNDVIRIKSNKERIEECLILSTDVLTLTKYCGNFSFNTLTKFKDYRTWGNCYGYYQILKGCADVMIDPLMSPWDIASLIPIINWSGGVISDCYGEEANIYSKGIVASCNKLIHNKVLELIN